MNQEIVNSAENTEQVKEPVIGEFKPKRKYLNFVSALSSARVRLLRDSAFIRGELLSGTLDHLKFKITICSEGTINFEEIDTVFTDKAQLQRLLDDIDSMDVTGYAQKFIVSGLEFTDIDGHRCYLEVEHQKPIDKLKSLFDEPKSEEKVEVTKKGLSMLDQLFADDSDSDDSNEVAEEKEIINLIIEPEEKKENYLEETFKKINAQKIDELKYRIEKKENDIKICSADLKNAETKLKEDTNQLRVLENRLESMVGSADDPNGYVFYVSEEQKSDIGIDDATKNIAGKIADIMKLKKDVLFDYLTEGFYRIKIAKKDDFKNESPKIEKGIIEKVASIDVVGKFSIKDSNELEYRGEFNWHQLVQRMIRKGFEQEPEFDKLCQSNSYESKEEKKCDCDSHGCKCK